MKGSSSDDTLPEKVTILNDTLDNLNDYLQKL